MRRTTYIGITLLIIVHLWRRYVGVRWVRRRIARREAALAPRLPKLTAADLYGVRYENGRMMSPDELSFGPGAIWAVDDLEDMRILHTGGSGRYTPGCEATDA